MKKLQNNFTTTEQSYRLLGLGVPAKSADCYYDGRKILRVRGEAWMLESNFFNEYSYFTPCWSVGRLIEIYLKCSKLEQRQVRFICDGDNNEYSLIDYVITVLVLESGVMTNNMDFSKLKD